MKTVFILDFETTSADPKTARPWEFAGRFATYEDGRWTAGHELSARMWLESYEDITEGAMRACRLKSARLSSLSPSFKTVFETKILPLTKRVDYWIAYNAGFDRTVLEQEALRQAVTLPKMNWLCAMNDIDYAPHFRCKQLSHLALDHGLIVDPTTLHGALGDVRLLSKLLEFYSLDEMVEYASAPWVYVKATLPDPWGASKAASEKLRVLAKKEGFSWEQTRVSDKTFPKTWVKPIKESKLQAELAITRPYPVTLVGD